MSEALYTRIEPEQIERLYRVFDARPITGEYQQVLGSSLRAADPIGLLYYVEEGEITEEMDYKHIALELELPIPYLIGFDIAWEGMDIEEQVVAAELIERYGFDLQDSDLWLGAADGATCRQKIPTGGTE